MGVAERINEVDSRVVWDIVTTKLPTLRREVEQALGELAGAEDQG